MEFPFGGIICILCLLSYSQKQHSWLLVVIFGIEISRVWDALVKAGDKLKSLDALEKAKQPEEGDKLKVRDALRSHEGPCVPGPAPNMSGVWKMCTMEGDLDGFLEYMGFKKGTRLLMRTIFTAGEGVWVVGQNGDDISLRVKRLNLCAKFRVGAGPCVTDSELGVVDVVGTWEGSALRFEAITSAGKGFTRWMYLKDKELVMIQISAEGHSTETRFQWQAPNKEE